jgi:hypothetical protein
MQEQLAKIQKNKNGKFDVMFDDFPIGTHKNDYFPPLEEDIATILADDLNFVYQNIKSPGYRHSFVYCVLSTLHHTRRGSVCGDNRCQMNRYELAVDITNLIHYDRCFRISPDPKFAIPERWANDPVVDFLGDDWVDLPTQVPRETTQRFVEVLDGFSRAQRFSVTLISDIYNDFSVSLTTLLIAKLVSPEDYFLASLIFRYYKTSDRLTKKEKLERDDFIPRMNNLLKALDSEGIKALI